jgi:hypothetical protein
MVDGVCGTPGRVAACIGLVSDTHLPDRLDALPPALFDVFGSAGARGRAGAV